MFHALLQHIPRAATLENLPPILEKFETIRFDIINILDSHEKNQIASTNESQIERHIQNSNPESISESEPGLETGREPNRHHEPRGGLERREPAMAAKDGKGSRTIARNAGALKSFPLGMILRSCPDIVDYGPGGAIASCRDLMMAAIVVHSMLGVSTSAYEEAASVMGTETAAIVMACILQRGGRINSAGGYLRDLTRRAERSEFALSPMLMALLRTEERFPDEPAHRCNSTQSASAFAGNCIQTKA
jgi:replication initiation protein RepC